MARRPRPARRRRADRRRRARRAHGAHAQRARAEQRHREGPGRPQGEARQAERAAARLPRHRRARPPRRGQAPRGTQRGRGRRSSCGSSTSSSSAPTCSGCCSSTRPTSPTARRRSTGDDARVATEVVTPGDRFAVDYVMHRTARGLARHRHRRRRRQPGPQLPVPVRLRGGEGFLPGAARAPARQGAGAAPATSPDAMFAVFRKDLRIFLRDRSALVFSLLMPDPGDHRDRRRAVPRREQAEAPGPGRERGRRTGRHHVRQAARASTPTCGRSAARRPSTSCATPTRRRPPSSSRPS